MVFPLVLLLGYQRYYNPLAMRARFNFERFNTLLENVNQKSETIALYTIFLPILRELLCAVTVTTLDKHQPSSLVFMYSTFLYLAFLLSSRTYETGNSLARLEQAIILYLTYLMVLLTDYVQDSVYFELISR